MSGVKSTFAVAAVAFCASVASATAGGPNSYSTGVVEGPSITTYTASEPVLETFGAPIVQPVEAITYAAPVQEYVQPAPVYVEPAPVVHQPVGHGGNAAFGYQQSSECGGVLDGEYCLVILNDHMRRVKLDRPAGTILIGNPLIADVTVLGKDTVFVSARTIGSTNLIALDKDGNEIITYEIFVREPRTKRVTLRNLDQVETYQCAPNCLRALTQSDSQEPFNSRAAIISTDLGLDRQAVSAQAGSIPPQAAPNPGPAAVEVPEDGSPVSTNAQPQGLNGRSALTSGVSGLAAATGPAASLLGKLASSASKAPTGAAGSSAQRGFPTSAPDLPQ